LRKRNVKHSGEVDSTGCFFLVEVGALSFVECTNSVGLVARNASTILTTKTRASYIPKRFFPKKKSNEELPNTGSPGTTNNHSFMAITQVNLH